MSDLAIFGPLFDPTRVADDVETFIKRWIRDYLSAVERQQGLTPGQATTARPTSWIKRNLLADIPGEDMTPAIVIVSRGANGPPRITPQGSQIPMDIGIAAVTAGAGEPTDAARKFAGRYSIAIAGMMWHKRNLDVVPGRYRVLSWDDYRLDDLPAEEARTRAIARLEFTINVNDFIAMASGPATPTEEPDPFPPPDDRPTVADPQVTVRQEDDQ